MGFWSFARRDGHYIAPGVRGWLESPAAGASASDCLIVGGWAFASGAQIAAVSARGFGPTEQLRHGLRRDDVARAYPREPNAGQSGFSGYLELEKRPERSVRLEIWATLDDGREIRLFTRPLKRGRAFNSPENTAKNRRHRGTGQEARPRFEGSTAFLARFLGAGSRLTLPASAAPVVSVVVVVWNRADLTLTCLRSLALESDVPVEVIIVDNGSTDETADLLARVDGVRIVRNTANVGFTVAANQGAASARGDYLMFLNNDAELVPGAIASLLDRARARPSVGAVGGKLVFPDGRLQEAGSIVWNDGSCEAYGRGGDPDAPEHDFERSVDFCSGALLLTPRAVFEALGGFDERYKPAYYEDADYCARLWQRGYSVVYQPKAAAVHHEFGSATARDASIGLQTSRRAIFAERHAKWLSSQRPRDGGVLAARSHPHGQPSVLVIDDAAPDPRLGAGFPRAAALVRALADLGCAVTIYGTGPARRRSSRSSLFPDVEIVPGGVSFLPAFLDERRGCEAVVVSRPHNMQYVRAAVGSDLSALGAPCLYDAEAIYALREIGRRRAIGHPMTDAEADSLIAKELTLARGCAAVLTVSDAERRRFVAAGCPHVHVASHAVAVDATPTAFAARHGLLFVGSFAPESPNEDALSFLCRDVLPVLRDGGACDIPLVVAGSRLTPLGDASQVSWFPDVDDLTPLYDAARVFVAPTRYGAGIPLKVLEAAARGVPVVCTSLVANQLGWNVGAELIAADDPRALAEAIASLHRDAALWQRIRDAALARIAADYSVATFRSAIEAALASISSPAADRSRGR